MMKIGLTSYSCNAEIMRGEMSILDVMRFAKSKNAAAGRAEGRRDKNRTKNEKGVDKACWCWYTIRAKESRNGAPSSPQARAKGSTWNCIRQEIGGFCCSVGAGPAATFYF